MVVYLRQIFGFAQSPIKTNDVLTAVPGITFLKPGEELKVISNMRLLNIERIREFATLIMLACVAGLAVKKARQRLVFFFFAFGVWDLFYYIFLKIEIGWPRSWLDGDVFFLLPVAWVGPVFVPVLLSLVLIVWTSFYLGRRSTNA